jgi:hypothetical protein
MNFNKGTKMDKSPWMMNKKEILEMAREEIAIKKAQEVQEDLEHKLSLMNPYERDMYFEDLNTEWEIEEENNAFIGPMESYEQKITRFGLRAKDVGLF